MARSRSIIRDGVVPLIIFPALIFLARRFIFGHIFQSGLDKSIVSECESHATKITPYRLPYTGMSAIDANLCPMVTSFHMGLGDSDGFSFLVYFIGTGAPLVAIPLVESYRTGRSPFVALPVIFGLLSQIMTAGLVYPIYWLVYILSGGANIRRETHSGDAKITQAGAEAIVFGLVLGAAFPSLAMLMLSNPYVTAVWQFYPIYVLGAEFAHLALRPPFKHPQSGYKTILFLYAGIFAMCSAIHISTIWPLLRDMETLKRVYLPSLIAPAESTSASIRVLHLFKWDLVFTFTSFIISTLWFPNSLTQSFVLVLWYTITIPVLGPGAAVAGSALWKESSIQAVSKAKRS